MKKYRTIVIDPPWDVLAGPPWASNQKSLPLDYPTMSLDEIKELPVSNIADKDCQLYLWTINKYLRQAFDVLDSWGFKFSTCLTWIKKPNGIGLGGTYSNTTEFCLFAHKGKVDAKYRIDTTWWECKRRIHSEKPSEMMVIFENISNPPYLEMFARKKFNNVWDVWGNEVKCDIDLDEYREIKDD